ncbi:MAG: hypothetical protein AAF797_03895 [Planctomycetota bacterium]
MRRLVVGICGCLVCVLVSGGCVPNRLYNASPEQYRLELEPTDGWRMGVDVAIIEFDEFGMWWLPEQLEEAVRLIGERNAGSERGIMLVTYIHGWKNNADPRREKSDLMRFKAGMRRLALQLEAEGDPAPDHVIGVYLAWRGATNRVPLWETLSFWDRKATAERIASLPMRETLFRLADTAKQRRTSKVVFSGHSMGGMILAQTLAPTVTTTIISSGPEGVPVPADMVLLQNPALDGLTTFQFVNYLKRSGARVELRSGDGIPDPAPGPLFVSITTEADWATRVAFPAGQMVQHLSESFRRDLGEGLPSQAALANRAHGHLDFLISHKARLDGDEIVLDRIPGAYNTTPFWIVQTSPDISRDHRDIYNPVFLRLVERITKLNSLYDTSVRVWVSPQMKSPAFKH